jgi:hypothetical protein
VLTLVARGFSYGETANLLGISVHTVHSHVRNIYGKLSVNPRPKPSTKPASSGCCAADARAPGSRLALCLGLLALPGAGRRTTPPQDCPARVVLLRQAQAVLQPEGSLRGAAHRHTHAPLGQAEFPGRGGTATYRVTLPPRQGTASAMALAVHPGGQPGGGLGEWHARAGARHAGRPGYDAAKTVHLAPMDAGPLLHADRPNELVVQVTTQPRAGAACRRCATGPRPLLQGIRHPAALALCGVAGVLRGAGPAWA